MKKIKKHFGAIFLTIVLIAVFISNYQPGTWLSGWDNLMPELNLWMNIKRSLVAVWQEYQGLGLVGGMGHASDLIRQLILLPLSLFLPASWLRYGWHFGMLALGSFGIYFLLKKNFKLKESSNLLGALYCLLNFGTIQYFWPPFESLSTFWGFFPWLILSAWQVLRRPNKKNWLILALVNLLATPAFYVQTLFIVYLFCLGAVFGAFFLLKKRKEFKIKTVFKSLLIIFLVNSFWLLPFAYFLLTNLENPLLSVANQMYSEETFLRNQKRGNLVDFFLLRQYYFDFFDGPQPMMIAWQEYFNHIIPKIAGLVFSLPLLAGIISLVSKPKKPGKNLIRLGLLGIFFIGCVALLSDTLPFSFLNWLLRQSPFLDQAYRAPFTKFIAPVCFSFSILIALGTEKISQLASKLSKKITLFPFVVLLLSLFIFSYPVFKGNFIYPKMKVDIPQEYFQLIEFMKDQPKNARIANLPQGNYWGWIFYRWGARGSGFLWYGIEQPILDRAFDVWSLNNEQYYWELTYALQKQDLNLLEQIFEKYMVEYVLFDDNVFFPGEKEYAKFSLNTKELLEKSARLKKIKTFGQIDLYQFDQSSQPFVAQNLPTANNFSFGHLDPIFRDNGNYQVEKEAPRAYYPFANLFTGRFQEELDFQIEEKEDHWRITKELPAFIDNRYSIVYDPSKQTTIIPDSDKDLLLNNTIKKEGKLLVIEIPKIDSPVFEKREFDQDSRLVAESKNNTLQGEYDLNILNDKDGHFVRLSSRNDDSALSVYSPLPSLANGWLIIVDYRWQKGLSLRTYGLGGPDKYKFYYTKLEKTKNWQRAYFIIPPYSQLDQSFSITVSNVSLNNHQTINDVRAISFLPFPYQLASSIRFEKQTKNPDKKNERKVTLNSRHFLWIYQVDNVPKGTLVLPQSHDNGWLAFSFNRGKIRLFDQVMINNWANGWEINQGEGKIIVFFWPQLLEFLGLLLLPISFFFLLKKK